MCWRCCQSFPCSSRFACTSTSYASQAFRQLIPQWPSRFLSIWGNTSVADTTHKVDGMKLEIYRVPRFSLYIVISLSFIRETFLIRTRTYY